MMHIKEISTGKSPKPEILTQIKKRLRKKHYENSVNEASSVIQQIEPVTF